MAPDAPPAGEGAVPDPPLDTLGLPPRAYNALRKVGIDTMSKLLALKASDLLAINGIGPDTFHTIRDALDRYRANPPKYLPPVWQTRPGVSAALDENLSIDRLALSTRPYNALRRAGINTIAQLTLLSDERLLTVRNLGVESLREIRQKQEDYLLRRASDLDRGVAGGPGPGHLGE